MKLASLVLLTTVGCVTETNGSGEDTTPPVPTVTNAAPSRGDYGAEVVVRGRNLQLKGVRIQANDIEGNVVDLWQPQPVVLDPSTGKPLTLPVDTPATFPFPFPAEGEMTLTYEATTTSLGSFTPKWKAGRSYPLTGETVLGSAALATSTIALVTSSSKGLGFVIFDDAVPRFVAIDPAITTMDRATMRTTADGSVEAVVASASDKPILVSLTGTTATTTPLAVDGTFLGSGVDNGDFIVAMKTTDAKVQRYRNGQLEGDAVALPSESARHHVDLVSGDGTVVSARDGAGGSTFDDVADFSMQALGPKDTAFGAVTRFASLDDVATQLDGEVIGGVIQLSYCAVDSGWFSATETHCAKSYTVNGKDVIEPQMRDHGIAVSGARVSQTSCNERNQLTIDGAPALYPCNVGTIHGLALGQDAGRILVSKENKLYAARQR